MINQSRVIYFKAELCIKDWVISKLFKFAEKVPTNAQGVRLDFITIVDNTVTVFNRVCIFNASFISVEETNLGCHCGICSRVPIISKQNEYFRIIPNCFSNCSFLKKTLNYFKVRLKSEPKLYNLCYKKNGEVIMSSVDFKGPGDFRFSYCIFILIVYNYDASFSHRFKEFRRWQTRCVGYSYFLQHIMPVQLLSKSTAEVIYMFYTFCKMLMFN